MFAALLPYIGYILSAIQLAFIIGIKYGDMKNMGKTMDRIEAKTNNHAERIARIEGCLENRLGNKDGQ
jgi:hypothetical protein